MRFTKNQQEIYDCLIEHGPMETYEIANKIGQLGRSLGLPIAYMVKAGAVEKDGKKYTAVPFDQIA